MNEKEKLLWEIEKRGGSITTYDLHGPGMPLQYQRVLKELREKLRMKGITLTEGIPVHGQKRNFLYKIIKPFSQELFTFIPTQHGESAIVDNSNFNKTSEIL